MMKRITIFTFLFLISHFSFLISHLGSTASAQSWTADNGNGTFTNPLFYDEFSDPDILRVGDSALEGLGELGKYQLLFRPFRLRR